MKREVRINEIGVFEGTDGEASGVWAYTILPALVRAGFKLAGNSTPEHFIWEFYTPEQSKPNCQACLKNPSGKCNSCRIKRLEDAVAAIINNSPKRTLERLIQEELGQ